MPFDLQSLVSRAFVLLTVMPIHEYAHAAVASWLGDDTAEYHGRLSLNPFHHLDLMGSILILFAGFGWAKPVPVNMMYFKNPKRGMALTALAGPASNVLLTAVMLALYGPLYILMSLGIGGWAIELLTEMVSTTAYLSMAFAVFNLLPVPPLDGSKILFSVLSDRNYLKLMIIERYGMILMLILVSTGILRTPLSYVTGFCFDLLFPIAQVTADWTVALLWR